MDVDLPRFEIKGNGISLVRHLQTLGMKRAFGESADFSGITEEPA